MNYLLKLVKYSRGNIFMILFVTLLCATSIFYWSEGGLYIFLLYVLLVLIYLGAVAVKVYRGQL